MAKFISFFLNENSTPRDFPRKSVAFVSDRLMHFRIMCRFVRVQFKQLTLLFSVLAFCAFG
ncbi:MAG: hypothetical protein ACKVGW_12805, partial [Verrucomicrobiia bacterium]